MCNQVRQPSTIPMPNGSGDRSGSDSGRAPWRTSSAARSSQRLLVFSEVFEAEIFWDTGWSFRGLRRSEFQLFCLGLGKDPGFS